MAAVGKVLSDVFDWPETSDRVAWLERFMSPEDAKALCNLPRPPFEEIRSIVAKTLESMARYYAELI
jgi:hypothetical protein